MTHMHLFSSRNGAAVMRPICVEFLPQETDGVRKKVVVTKKILLTLYLNSVINVFDLPL